MTAAALNVACAASALFDFALPCFCCCILRLAAVSCHDVVSQAVSAVCCNALKQPAIHCALLVIYASLPCCVLCCSALFCGAQSCCDAVLSDLVCAVFVHVFRYAVLACAS